MACHLPSSLGPHHIAPIVPMPHRQPSPATYPANLGSLHHLGHVVPQLVGDSIELRAEFASGRQICIAVVHFES